MMPSIRYAIIRGLYCPVPGLDRAVPLIGGKSVIDIVIIAMLIAGFGVLAYSQGEVRDQAQ